MIETSTIDDFLAATLRSLRASELAAWELPEDLDWDQVWSRIEYHGIPFLLHSKSHQLRDWPRGLLDRMAEEARLVILWETTHHDVVSRLLRELGAAGIETVLMKGTALAYSLHDEPATRRRGDTDLLVDPKDEVRTRSILSQLGWHRREDPHGLYYQEGWGHDAAGFFVHSVDLHWEPSDRPALQGILPLEAFFTNRRAMPKFGPNAYRPEPGLMLLHATINQKWHAIHGYHAEAGLMSSPRRLIWSVDFDLLLRSMAEDDWRRLWQHCEEHRVGPLVAEALRGMQRDLACDLPENALSRLETHPLDETLARYFANPDSLTQFWIDLGKARTVAEKRRLVLMRAFPPREHLTEKFPDAKNWPIALLRGRMLWHTAGRIVRRAIPG